MTFPFPNIPIALGVPPLLRSPLAPIIEFALMVADTIILLGGSVYAPQWGVFQAGFPVITADSVISMEYKQDWALATYPVEQGAFESYDKVSQPFDTRVRFSMGGSLFDRQQFLESIEAIAGTLDLYDVLTPERLYRSVNITHYDYKRTARNGVGLLQVDIHLTEVRVTAAPAFSNTQSATGNDEKNNGPITGTEAKPPVERKKSTLKVLSNSGTPAQSTAAWTAGGEGRP